MDEISEITAYDKSNKPHHFKVSVEDLEENGYEGKYFKIYEGSKNDLIHFEYKVLFITENRVMILMINNHNVESLSGKGITKAMTLKILSHYKKNVVSSTNSGEKFSDWEGRVGNVNKMWNKWREDYENIEYDLKEDRFIWRYNEVI